MAGCRTRTDAHGCVDTAQGRQRLLQEAWSEQVATILNGEEADEIAVHFRSEGAKRNAASSSGSSAN